MPISSCGLKSAGGTLSEVIERATEMVGRVPAEVAERVLAVFREPMPLRQMLDVTAVEQLHADVRIQALDLSELSILASHEGLLHHRYFDEEVLLR